jgi:hypothetical protein
MVAPLASQTPKDPKFTEKKNWFGRQSQHN